MSMTAPGLPDFASRPASTSQSELVSRMGRIGYTAKAVVYSMMGLLVFRLAFGGSSEDASSEGAFDALSQQPMGPWLVGATAVGLATYSLWRVAMLFLADPSDDDSSMPAWATRAGWVLSALTNAWLAYAAARQVLGGSSGSGEQSTGTIFELPGGVVLVGLGGLAVIGLGISQGHKAVTGSWADRLDFSTMSVRQRNATIALGKAGHAGRALAWSLAGGFVLHAALTFDPDEPVGLDAALREVQQAGYGMVVLLAVALGLLAYGLWCGTITLWGDPDA